MLEDEVTLKTIKDEELEKKRISVSAEDIVVPPPKVSS